MRLESATTADVRYLRHAIRIAAEGTSRMRHGAVLHRSGRLLRIARNRSRVQDQWLVDRPREECTVHAEAALVKSDKTGKTLQGATVLVVRVNRSGQLRPSAPCPACWNVLDAAGVRKVVHS